MEQINQPSPDPLIIRNVEAMVFHVDEKLMRLKSQHLNQTDYIQISAAVAFSKMPRQDSSTTALTDVIRPGDWVILDVVYERGIYVPHHIRAITLLRPNETGGNILIANGLLISLTEDGGPMIRNPYAPDFAVPMDKWLTNAELRIGSAVAFEVILTGDSQLLPICARMIGSAATNIIEFQIYRGIGTVCYGDGGRTIMVEGHTANGPVMMPIYHSARYGCGMPVVSLIGDKVNFTACPMNPYGTESPLEVVYFDLISDEAAAQMSDRLPSTNYNTLGESMRDRGGIREGQSVSYFSADFMQELEKAFVWIVDRANIDSFDRMLKKYPVFCTRMCQKLGIDQMLTAAREKSERQQVLQSIRRQAVNTNMQQQQQQREFAGRVPKPPDFTPDEIFGVASVEPPSPTPTPSTVQREIDVQENQQRVAHDIWFEQYVSTLPPIVLPTPVNNNPSPIASTRIVNDESFESDGEQGDREEYVESQPTEHVRRFENGRGNGGQQQQPGMSQLMTPLSVARAVIQPLGRTNLDLFQAPGASVTASGDGNSSGDRADGGDGPSAMMWPRGNVGVKRVAKGTAG